MTAVEGPIKGGTRQRVQPSENSMRDKRGTGTWGTLPMATRPALAAVKRCQRSVQKKRDVASTLRPNNSRQRDTWTRCVDRHCGGLRRHSWTRWRPSQSIRWTVLLLPWHAPLLGVDAPLHGSACLADGTETRVSPGEEPLRGPAHPRAGGSRCHEDTPLDSVHTRPGHLYRRRRAAVGAVHGARPRRPSRPVCVPCGAARARDRSAPARVRFRVPPGRAATAQRSIGASVDPRLTLETHHYSV